jgi:hypothetical protein
MLSISDAVVHITHNDAYQCYSRRGDDDSKCQQQQQQQLRLDQVPGGQGQDRQSQETLLLLDTATHVHSSYQYH